MAASRMEGKAPALATTPSFHARCHIFIHDTVLRPPGLSASCVIKLFELTEGNYAGRGHSQKAASQRGPRTRPDMGWMEHGGPHAGLRSVPEEGGKRQAIAGSVRMPGISEQKVMSLARAVVFSSVCA